MLDDVPEDVKKERLKIINSEQENIATELNDKFKGRCEEVLVEDTKKGRWFGRNRNDKLVFFDSEETFAGEVVKVNIEDTSPWFLEGSKT
jgi:tRNA-2-methylthio-N6-dimethylallyladenosine synthase